MKLMELQLGLAPPTNPSKLLDLNDPFNSKSHKKRPFSKLLDHASQDVMLPTLSLLPLTPNLHHDHYDHDDDQRSHCSSVTNEEEGVVGWPPLNYWRKKLRLDHNSGDDDEVVGNNNDHMVWVHHHHGSVDMGGSKNTLFVKVKMEGVGIARKVDLGMHQSFHTLKETLMDMFGKCHQLSNTYQLAYQDKEGDWLLAQDVPWRQVNPTMAAQLVARLPSYTLSFVACARRLKLLKGRG